MLTRYAPKESPMGRAAAEMSRDADENLTPHEVRLLRLLSEGHSYQTIGDRLGISINTVRNYIRTVYEKLHVHSKAEAVSKALKRRIIL